MKKIWLLFLIIVFIGGCSSEEIRNKTVNENSSLRNFDGISILGDPEHQEAIMILRPLLEASLLEKGKIMAIVDDIVENLTLDEQLIQDLREYMLLYYTEEITNETCTLLEYKYNNVLEIKEFTEELYEFDTWGIEGYSPLEFNQFRIIEADLREKDRIRLFLEANEPEIETTEEFIFSIVLEKEGSQWYLSDLVFSRYIIEGLGSVYRR